MISEGPKPGDFCLVHSGRCGICMFACLIWAAVRSTYRTETSASNTTRAFYHSSECASRSQDWHWCIPRLRPPPPRGGMPTELATDFARDAWFWETPGRERKVQGMPTVPVSGAIVPRPSCLGHRALTIVPRPSCLVNRAYGPDIVGSLWMHARDYC